jgi:hypothetical protein
VKGDLPIVARYWHESSRDLYAERVAIMREGQNIPDNQPTPHQIVGTAMQQAMENEKLLAEKQLPLTLPFLSHETYATPR